MKRQTTHTSAVVSASHRGLSCNKSRRSLRAALALRVRPDKYNDMEEKLSKLFEGTALSAVEEGDLLEQLQDKAERTKFVQFLNQQRVKRKEVAAEPFEQLVVAVRTGLRICNAESDLSNGKNLVNMSATFHKGSGASKEFVQSRLRDEVFLKNIHLWEELFFDQIAAEKRKMEAGLVFSSLPPDEQADAIVRFRNVVFGQLGTYVFNMMECGVDTEAVRMFAHKMCAASELAADDEEYLMQNINSSMKPVWHPVADALARLLSGVPISSGM